MKFPQIFEDNSLIETMCDQALVADALCAWANCHLGNSPPDSFGTTLVAVGNKIGIKGGMTSENLIKFAETKGWIETK